MKYDPETPPSPGAWLASDEEERLAAVLEQHAADGVKLPSARLHAALHVVVENQVAEGHAAVRRALERLLSQGLERHAAVHAIADVVAVQMRAHLVRGADRFDAAAYDRDLDALGAEPAESE